MEIDLWSLLILAVFVLPSILRKLKEMGQEGMKGANREAWAKARPARTQPETPAPPQDIWEAREARTEPQRQELSVAPSFDAFDDMEREVEDIRDAETRVGRIGPTLTRFKPNVGSLEPDDDEQESGKPAAQADLIALLKDPRTAGQAIIAAEVVGRPRSMRRSIR